MLAAGGAGGAGANGAGAAPARPRSLGSAVDGLGGANVALVSVPGEYAALEAHRALSRGLHVFLFSDHVSVDDEVALKRRGGERGLLVMGPGCGTAMLGGVGLGFANVVPSGPVGIVAAAGTGAQEAACLVAAAGGGVSQIVGVGGRDLSAEVGGLAFRQALALLGEDERPRPSCSSPSPRRRTSSRRWRDALPPGKRAVAAFVGLGDADAPLRDPRQLEAAAPRRRRRAPARRRGARARRRRPPRRVGRARAARALLRRLARPRGGDDRRARARPGRGQRDRARRGAGRAPLLDLGEEEYTRGRPHPMVDLDLRVGMIEDAAGDDALGCLLLDVVLGHGAHPDPAGELAGRCAASRSGRRSSCACAARPRTRRTRAARPRRSRPRARSSRRRTPRRRGSPCGRSRADDRRRPARRDAHVLRAPARRRRARDRRRRGARGPRPRGRAVRRRPARLRVLPRARGPGGGRPP